MSVPSLIPPFGRILLAFNQENIKLDVSISIFVGQHSRYEAITSKKLGALCTFLPFGDDYQRYHWPINNQKIIVEDSGGNSAIYLKKMCLYLLSTHNPRVIFLYSNSVPNELFLPKGASYNG